MTSHVITKPYLVETLDRKKRELPKGLKMRNVPFGTGENMSVYNIDARVFM